MSSQRITVAALICPLFFLPLAILPGLLLQYYTTPKLVVAYLSAATLCVAIVGWWPGAFALWRTMPGRWLFGILFGLLVSLFVSALLSDNVWLSLGGTPAQRLGFLTQSALLLIAASLAAQVHRHRRFAQTALLSIEAAVALASVYATLQYVALDPLLPPSLYKVAGALRPPATFGQATYFASFLLPGILIAAWFIMREQRLAWRAFHGIVLVLGSTALLLSGTRSAILGLLAGLSVLAFAESRFLGRRRLVQYVAVALTALVAIPSALIVSPLGHSFRVRLEQWIHDSRGGPRLMVWHDSLGLIKRRWAFGSGPETFAGEFRKIQSLELSRAYPDHFHESPHNLFIEVAAGQGTLGLVAVLSLLALGVLCGVRLIRQGAPEGSVLLASLTALVVSLQFSPLTIPLWLQLYAIVALLAALAAPPSPVPPHAPREVPPPPPLAVRIPAIVVAFLLAGFAVLFAVQDALVAVTTRRLVASDLEGASSAYRLLNRSPFTADSLWCSTQMAAFARSQPAPNRASALGLAREASADAEREGDQTFSALYQSATLAIIAGDSVEAENHLRAAIAASPNWYRAHAMLAQFLWSKGRGSDAEREAALALQTAGTLEPRVRSALDRARAQAQSN